MKKLLKRILCYILLVTLFVPYCSNIGTINTYASETEITGSSSDVLIGGGITGSNSIQGITGGNYAGSLIRFYNALQINVVKLECKEQAEFYKKYYEYQQTWSNDTKKGMVFFTSHNLPSKALKNVDGVGKTFWLNDNVTVMSGINNNAAGALVRSFAYSGSSHTVWPALFNKVDGKDIYLVQLMKELWQCSNKKSDICGFTETDIKAVELNGNTPEKNGFAIIVMLKPLLLMAQANEVIKNGVPVYQIYNWNQLDVGSFITSASASKLYGTPYGDYNDILYVLEDIVRAMSNGLGTQWNFQYDKNFTEGDTVGKIAANLANYWFNEKLGVERNKVQLDVYTNLGDVMVNASTKSCMKYNTPSVELVDGEYKLSDTMKYYGRTVFYDINWKISASGNIDCHASLDEEKYKPQYDKNIVTSETANLSDGEDEELILKYAFKSENIPNALSFVEKSLNRTGKYSLRTYTIYTIMKDGKEIIPDELSTSNISVPDGIKIETGTYYDKVDKQLYNCIVTSVHDVSRDGLVKWLSINEGEQLSNPIEIKIKIPESWKDTDKEEIVINFRTSNSLEVRTGGIDLSSIQSGIQGFIYSRAIEDNTDYNGIPYTVSTEPIEGDDNTKIWVSNQYVLRGTTSKNSVRFAVDPTPVKQEVKKGDNLKSEFKMYFTEDKNKDGSFKDGTITKRIESKVADLPTMFTIDVKVTNASEDNLPMKLVEVLSADGTTAKGWTSGSINETEFSFDLSAEDMVRMLKGSITPVLKYEYTLPNDTEEHNFAQLLKFEVKVKDDKGKEYDITTYNGADKLINASEWSMTNTTAKASWVVPEVSELKFEYAIVSKTIDKETDLTDGVAQPSEFDLELRVKDDYTKWYLSENPTHTFTLTVNFEDGNPTTDQRGSSKTLTLSSITANTTSECGNNDKGTISVSNLTAEQILGMNERSGAVTVIYEVPDNNLSTMEQTIDAEVIIVDVSTEKQSVATPAKESLPGWDYSKPHSKASWINSAYETTWDWHSTKPTAYAEIVANEVGGLGTSLRAIDITSQDWNVMQGIPSTENVSIAAGGALYQIDLSGKYIVQGTKGITEDDELFKNNFIEHNVNEANTSAAFTRKITFKVYTQDRWGEDNPLCVLSCPGHGGKDNSHDCTQTASTSCCGGSSPCPLCGWAPPAPGHTTDDKGRIVHHTNVRQCPNSSSHTISWNCGTNAVSAVGNNKCTATITAGSPNSYHQRYTGISWSWSCGHCGGGASNTEQYTSLLEEGYTDSMGCVCSKPENCIHKGSYCNTYVVHESIDIITYRQILNMVCYGLEKAQIVNYNPNVVEPCIGESSSNAGLHTFLWRGTDKYKPNSPDGRLFFTQFKEPKYTGENWVSTDIYGGSISSTSNPNGYGIVPTSCYNKWCYWLGDCTILINYKADADCLAMQPGGVQDLDDTVGMIQNRGDIEEHYKTPSPCTEREAYKGDLGDYMPMVNLNKMSAHVVNAWLANNQGTYAANVISDTFVVGCDSEEKLYQTIRGEVYGVGSPIPLFNCGFTDTIKNVYRNHAHGDFNSNTVLSLMANNNYSIADVQDSGTGVIEGGYAGSPAWKPSSKYRLAGRTNPLQETLGYGLYLVHSNAGTPGGLLSDYESRNNVKWTNGNNGESGSGNYYTRPISYNKVNYSGQTQSRIQTIPKGNDLSNIKPETVVNYYRDHNYPYKGTYQVLHKTNSAINSGAETIVTNSGDYNMYKPYADPYGEYRLIGNALTISNIDLKDTAPNGLYEEPVTVVNSYVEMANMSNDTSTWTDCKKDRTTELKCVYTKGSTGINPIVIHDPVSVEYCQIITNNYEPYESNVVDERGEDLRTGYSAVAEDNKNKYLVLGNTFHIWVSDFGDFNDDFGNTNMNVASDKRGYNYGLLGANSKTGVINSNARGYTDNMNCGVWTKNRYVTFQFAVSYKDKNGIMQSAPAGTRINLNEVMANRIINGTEVEGVMNGPHAIRPENFNKMYHYGSDTLQNFWNNDLEFKYGLDYAFNILTSSTESIKASVKFEAEAINGSTAIATAINETNKERSFKEANHAVLREEFVEVVGRIGNLTINDTQDFRFSNLFKTARDEWLLNGVVHEVNDGSPEVIIATPKDILFTDLLNSPTKSHATLSVTDILLSETGNGKGGPFLNFPLNKQLNNLDEYKDDNLRFGYDTYMDIETIGDYKGVNRKWSLQTKKVKVTDLDENVPVEKEIEVEYYIDAAYKGPEASKDEIENSGIPDDRQYVVDIVPHYYLYDPDEQKFYTINMYAGYKGAYNLFWTEDTTNPLMRPVSELFVNSEEERLRRNITDVEERLTLNALRTGTTMETSVFTEEDYIGTPSRIRLDQFNRSYIGSPFKYGTMTMDASKNVIRYNNTGYDTSERKTPILNIASTADADRIDTAGMMSNYDWITSSQRWHFTLGVPSSTYITYEGAGNKQLNIEESHTAIKAEHPNACIIAFIDVSVRGDVWDLQYIHSKFDSTVIDIEGSEIDYANAIVYDKNGSDTGVRISSYWAPVLCYNAYSSSSDDLDTFGTH